jgi:deoxyadenosine/deoxycytidine kinase
MDTTFAINTMNYVKTLVSIQGSIGAGKSTVFASIKQWIDDNGCNALNYERMDGNSQKRHMFLVIDEPVNGWTVPKYSSLGFRDFPGGLGQLKSALELFYENMSKMGFWFQIVAFTTRLDLIIAGLRSLNPAIFADDGVVLHIISERSLRTDRLFFKNLWESNMITQAEFVAYTNFYDVICETTLKKEDIMIYLPTSPEKCASRISARARAGEVDDNHEKIICAIISCGTIMAVIALIFPWMIPYLMVAMMLYMYGTLWYYSEKKIDTGYLKSLETSHKTMVGEFEENGGKVIILDVEDDMGHREIDAKVRELMCELMDKIA